MTVNVTGQLSKIVYNQYRRSIVGIVPSNNEIVEMIIRQLEDEKYLDDKIFAQTYLENRKRNKPKSIFAFRYELKNKGIHPTIIDELLTDFDDIELAFLAIKPKIRLWKHLNNDSFKKKVFGHLRYRGFNFSVIQSIWQEICTNSLVLDRHPDTFQDKAK